jgi:hypothetical protein
LDSGRFLFKGGQNNILCDENLFYDAKVCLKFSFEKIIFDF